MFMYSILVHYYLGVKMAQNRLTSIVNGPKTSNVLRLVSQYSSHIFDLMEDSWDLIERKHIV